MNERTCYLIIDKVDYTQTPYGLSQIIEKLFIRNGFQINSDGLAGVQQWCTYHSQDENSLQLDMFKMTKEIAEKEIAFLKSEGIHARIQYHATEIEISNDISFNINKEEITSDINQMKQYLKDIYTLEKELYCSQQAQKSITDIINSLGKPKEITIQGRSYDSVGTTLGLTIFVGIVYAVAGGFIGIFTLGLIFEEFGALLGAIIGLFVSLFKMGSAKKDDDEAVRENNRLRNEAIANDNARVEKELSRIPFHLENEKLYSENVTSCKNALNQLYNANIIFPKYRNLVAISQIYEYFMSGRCTELEGHEGAYNIYENEIRQNVIIYQLNEVLTNLEEIKNTQYMIYDAIQNSNRILAKIEDKTSAIAYNSSIIAQNTAICSRYAQRGRY